MKINKYNYIFLILCSFLGFQGTAQELDDYLEFAAENNPGIKASYARFEAALQEVPQVRSLPDPNLSMGFFGPPNERARFSLMQMFPWFGTLGAKEEQASLMAEAKFQAFLDARNELFFKVSEKYHELYGLTEAIKFQKSNQEILETYKELALSKVRSGNGALADVLKVNLLIDLAQTELEILQMQRKPLEAQFNALLNNKEGSLTIVFPQDLELDLEGLTEIDSDFLSNPKLVALEKMTAAASAQEEVARKNGLPSFGIGVEYMIMEGNAGMGMDQEMENALMPMLSVSLPIFRKKHKAARQEARFLQESYVQNKAQTENMLEAEYEMAFFQMEKSIKMLKLFEKQVRSTEQILELLLSSFGNATGDFEEILRVQQQLLDYQLKRAGAKTDYFTAVARMEYLTGKSFDYEDQK